MNGATAVPDVKKTRPLSAMSITMIGTSQYAFRSRMKLHSSPMNSRIADPSLVLSFHVGRGPRAARDPVRRRISIESPAHRIAANQATNNRYGNNQHVVDKAEDDSAVHPAQRFADHHPYPVKRPEHGRNGQRDHCKHGADDL